MNYKLYEGMPILIKINYKLMSVTMLVDYYQGKALIKCYPPLIINSAWVSYIFKTMFGGKYSIQLLTPTQE